MRFKTWIIAGLMAGSAQAATITGTVTEAGSGLPIQNAIVGINDVDYGGQFPLDSVTTDAMGNYTLTFSVNTGTDISPGSPANTHGNILLEVIAPAHQPQRFGDTGGVVDCFWFCEIADSFSLDDTGVFTMTDSDAVVRDFSLAPGAAISGTVTAAGGGPLADVPITLFTDERYERFTAFTATTIAGGSYVTPYAVKAGTMYVTAGAGDFQYEPVLPYGNYVSQAYGGFDCEFLSCPIQSTTPIMVPAGPTPVTGIDFALNAGGEINGEVRDLATGAGLISPEYAFIRIWTPDEGRSIGTFATANLFDSMMPSTFTLQGFTGSYILEIDPGPSVGSSATDLIRILNDGSRCPFAGCDRATAVPVNVPAGSVQTMNFSLNRGGKVEGTVTDAATMMPIDGQGEIAISIVDASDRVFGGGIIDSSGQITTADGISPGSYFVKTGRPFNFQTVSGGSSLITTPYSDQLYTGVDCQGLACDLANPSAIPVTITASGVTTGVDFSLALGHRISGTVTAAGSGDPLPNRNVEIYTSSGRRAALEFTDASGNFTTGGLPDGSYRVVVKDGGRVVLGNYGADGLGYFGKVYGNPADCMQQLCNPLSGTDVVISGADVTGIDFSLTDGPTISGQVIDTVRGLPILLTVDVYNASSTFVGAWSTIVSDDASYTTGALFPGTYTLIPRTTKTYSIGSPSTITRGDLPPGTLQIDIADSDVSNATMGAFASLIFAGDFEAR